MMSKPLHDIVVLNDLELHDNGVYASKSVVPSFDYSDGEATEQALSKILTESVDLSSNSKELESKVIDWPTEYHLSSTRANLLRPLDLSRATKVLELGCGCGSISRYLAEQSNLSIDAVEGSPVRAALAAQRCRDLDNIRFLTGNFNQLQIPENHYDAVLFVGVLEYAGRFSERDTDQQAVLDLLELAKRSLKPNGVAIIAIENRTGLKYAMGAKEDHYAVPFVGLDNYPDSTGIRTYDHAQWMSLHAQCSFAAQTTLLPFPDYKIPHLLLTSELSADDQSNATEALSTVRSRDYCSPDNSYPIRQHEARLWQAMVESGTLTQLSNSFLLLFSESEADLNRVCPRSPITAFEAPEFDYLKRAEANAVAAPNVIQTSSAQLKLLTQQLVALRTHASELEKIRQASEQRLGALESPFARRLAQSLRRFVRRVFGH